MRYLKTNTATTITVGPFLDKTDGITPEVALTATNEKLTMVVDNAGSPVLAIDANATASGGSNDFVHVTNDDGGYYTLELAAANVNYLGGALLSITYATDHCPVFHEFTILPAQVYDSLIAGTDLLDANASQLGGTTQTGRDVGASVLLSSGTGTGQVTLTSGRVNADLTHIATAAVSTSTAQLGVNMVSGAVGAITASVIATDAIGSDEISASAVTKIITDVKAKTDQLIFTKALELDVNVQSINGATVTGDGNSSPWDGA